MSKVSILLVEDDVTAAMDIKRSLESIGYSIPEIVSSGEDALLKLSEYKPDLILMDSILSGNIDGIDTAKSIKKRYKIPLIYLITHSESTIEREKLTEPYIYLVKPFDSNELKSNIEIALFNHQVEENLDCNSEHFQNLFENAPIGIFHSSLEGKFYRVNKTLSDMWGYESREELIKEVNKTSIEEKLYVDQNKRPIFVDNVLKDGKWHSFKNRYYKKDGSIMTAELSFRMVEDKNSTVRYLEGFVNDVTAQIEVERALQESEEKYRTLFEADPDYTLLLDNDTVIVDVNHATINMTGLSRDEIIGMALKDFDVIIEEDLMAHLDKISELMDGHKIKPFEVRLIDKDGKLRWINVQITTIEKGDVISFILIIASDITESKEFEMEIKDSLREKEVLLQEIHHRVKNNMQIISSLLNIQTRYVDDEESVNILKESQNRVKSMAMIHEKLYRSSDFNKIYFPNYIESLVWDLFYSYSIGKCKIKPVFEIDDIKLNIETSVPCGLIITELVSNSLKYAFPYQLNGELKVSFKMEDDLYTLTISDNGVGFPKNIDFKNTDSLGLQLVNSLTNQIEGEIELDNTNGTEFKIIFEELVYKERI